MKKPRYIALLLAVAMLTAALAGCTDGEQPGPTTAPPTQPTTQEATTTTQPPSLPPETQPPTTGLEYQAEFYDDALGDEGQDLVKLAVEGKPLLEDMAAVNNYYSTVDGIMREYAMQLEVQARDQLEQDQKSGRVFTPYTLDMSYTVMRNDGVVFSVLRQLTEYTGGAHEGMTLYAETFVVPGGEMLLLDDLFTVNRETYYPRISQAVQDAIAAAGNESDYFDYYKDRLMEIFQPGNFCLTGDGIMFFWQIYSIAPWASGFQTFEIPYADLADILDTKWIV